MSRNRRQKKIKKDQRERERDTSLALRLLGPIVAMQVKLDRSEGKNGKKRSFQKK